MSIHKKSLKTALTGALICTALALGTSALADAPPRIIQITTFEQLCKIGKDPEYPSRYVAYVLMNDIDASPSRGMNDGKGFEPIGTNASVDNFDVEDPYGFQGDFNGNGHVIKNLYINRPDEVDVGLFRTLAAPPYAMRPSMPTVVRNLGIEADTVIGGARVGGLAGFAIGYHGTADLVVPQAYITGCYVTGTVIAHGKDVGGLVGENRGKITNSYAAAKVVGLGAATSLGGPPYEINVGGLVGYNMGTIDSSRAAGDVSGIFSDAVGGLVGKNGDGRISRSYATGSVNCGSCNAGGLVGFLSNGVYYNDIENCYATGDVTGNGFAGGLVGQMNGGFIRNSYAAGAVRMGKDRFPDDPPWDGGLVGINSDPARVIRVYNSYWDITATGVSHSADGGEGKTTAEMRQQGTFEDWDFEGVWRIDEGESYPYFRYQGGADGTSISHNVRTGRNHANRFMPWITVRGRTLSVKLTSTQSSSNLKINMIDMRGRIVYSRMVDNNVNTLSLAKMPAGRYIVEVKNSGVRVGSVPVVIR